MLLNLVKTSVSSVQELILPSLMVFRIFQTRIWAKRIDAVVKGNLQVSWIPLNQARRY